jgi:hypothetical protein
LIDWQNAFDRVNKQIIQIINENGIDWSGRTLIRKLKLIRGLILVNGWTKGTKICEDWKRN